MIPKIIVNYVYPFMELGSQIALTESVDVHPPWVGRRRGPPNPYSYARYDWLAAVIKDQATGKVLNAVWVIMRSGASSEVAAKPWREHMATLPAPKEFFEDENGRITEAPSEPTR